MISPALPPPCQKPAMLYDFQLQQPLFPGSVWKMQRGLWIFPLLHSHPYFTPHMAEVAVGQTQCTPLLATLARAINFTACYDPGCCVLPFFRKNSVALQPVVTCVAYCALSLKNQPCRDSSRRTYVPLLLCNLRSRFFLPTMYTCVCARPVC